MRYLTLLKTLGLGLLLVAGLPSLASAALFTTLQSAAVAVGNGAPLTVNDKGTVGVSVTGTFVGTVTFEGSTDANTTWSSVNCTAITTLLTSTTTTTTGQFTCNTAGLTGFRARVSAWTSGSITVTAFPTMVGGGGGTSGGSGSATPTLAGCWATVAAPTYLEGTLNALACTLAGYLRVSVEAFNILISGENQTYNLLETSGGVVRPTVFSSVTSATSSSVIAVPIGPKTFMVQITNGTSETKAATVTIYGNWTNSTTGGIPLCLITLPSTATVTHLEDACPVITANFSYWYYTASVYTSASSAPLTVYAMY